MRLVACIALFFLANSAGPCGADEPTDTRTHWVYEGGWFAKSKDGSWYELNELTHRKVFGFGEGSQIKLEDTAGTVWRGNAERGDDQSVYYRFRSSDGGLLAGIGYGNQVMLRDSKGKVWKGFVD